MGKVEIGSKKIYSFPKITCGFISPAEMLLLAWLLLVDWTVVIKVTKWVKNKARKIEVTWIYNPVFLQKAHSGMTCMLWNSLQRTLSWLGVLKSD